MPMGRVAPSTLPFPIGLSQCVSERVPPVWVCTGRTGKRRLRRRSRHSMGRQARSCSWHFGRPGSEGRRPGVARGIAPARSAPQGTTSTAPIWRSVRFRVLDAGDRAGDTGLETDIVRVSSGYGRVVRLRQHDHLAAAHILGRRRRPRQCRCAPQAAWRHGVSRRSRVAGPAPRRQVKGLPSYPRRHESRRRAPSAAAEMIGLRSAGVGRGSEPSRLAQFGSARIYLRAIASVARRQRPGRPAPPGIDPAARPRDATPQEKPPMPRSTGTITARFGPDSHVRRRGRGSAAQPGHHQHGSRRQPQPG